MGKQVIELKRPDHQKTSDEVRDAISEVQHAIRPRVHSLKDGISWLVALAAGAFVAWRGYTAAEEGLPDGSDNVTANRAYIAELREQRRAELLGAGRTQPQPIPTVDHDRPKQADARAASAPHEPHAAETEERAEVQGPLALAKEAYARFNRDELLTRSQALAFIIVLSLIPALLFALAIVGFVVHNPQQATHYVQSVIARQLPGQTAQTAQMVIQQAHVTDATRTLVDQKWWSAIIGVLLLLWSALGLLVSAVQPMDASWEVQETRGFVELRLVCLKVLAGAGILFLLSLVVSSGAFHPSGVPWIVNAALTVIYELIAVALDAGMFIVIYRYLPNANVTWKAAIFGGVITGVLWEVAKKLFEFYVSNFGSFNKVYGALGGLAGLVTWIWYSCVVLLVGALLCKMYHEHKEEGGVKKRASQG